MAQTPVLPEVAPVGALSARLRRSRSTAIDPRRKFFRLSILRLVPTDSVGSRLPARGEITS
jgi:hypothetical protein